MPDALSTTLRTRTQLEVSLGLRAAADREQLLAVDETIREHRPRQLDGEEPDQAQHWLAAGLDDEDVVEWLEAGVPWATSATQLQAVGLRPRDIAREHETGVTLGLAFARGELSLDEVQHLVVGEVHG